MCTDRHSNTQRRPITKAHFVQFNLWLTPVPVGPVWPLYTIKTSLPKHLSKHLCPSCYALSAASLMQRGTYSGIKPQLCSSPIGSSCAQRGEDDGRHRSKKKLIAEDALCSRRNWIYIKSPNQHMVLHHSSYQFPVVQISTEGKLSFTRQMNEGARQQCQK